MDWSPMPSATSTATMHSTNNNASPSKYNNSNAKHNHHHHHQNPSYQSQQQQQQQQQYPNAPRSSPQATTTTTNSSNNNIIIPQPPHTRDELHFAKRTLQKLVQDSYFFPNANSTNKNNSVQTLQEKEFVNVGDIIGKGGFCEVRGVTTATSLKRSMPTQGSSSNGYGSSSQHSYGSGSHSHSSNSYNSNNSSNSNNNAHPNNNNNNNVQYAMKYLSPSKTSSTRIFQRGIADLAMEACFLSLLSHEYIIGLHYVSEGTLEENYGCCDVGQQQRRQQQQHVMREEIVMDANGNLCVKRHYVEQQQPRIPRPPNNHVFGYFLLLDPLNETLTQRIDNTYIPSILAQSCSHHDHNVSDNSYSISWLNSSMSWKSYYDGENATMEESESETNCTNISRYNKLWDKIRHPQKIPSLMSLNASNMSMSTAGAGGDGGDGKFNQSNSSTFNHIHNPTSYAQLAQRLENLKCIASALQYLHTDCHILFRDVKPDNIGFYRRYHPKCTCGHNAPTNNGTTGSGSGRKSEKSIYPECICYDEITKLFDFGLAKELKSKYRSKVGRHQYDDNGGRPYEHKYKLTSCTGSRRYMAPEVALAEPYNEKSDVYSFGMLLYQVSSLVTPFDGYSMGKHEREVLRGGYRPDVTLPLEGLGTSNDGGNKKGNNNDKWKSNLIQQEREQERILEEELKASSSLQHNSSSGGTGSSSDKRNALLAIRTKRYWPRELSQLINECWEHHSHSRPSMKEVTERLDGIIIDLMHHL